MDVNLLELEKDIAELDKLLGIAVRPNILRNLENHKKTITTLIESEKRLIEEKSKVEVKTENTNTVKTNVEDKYQYTTITKYAFENTDKFAK